MWRRKLQEGLQGATETQSGVAISKIKFYFQIYYTEIVSLPAVPAIARTSIFLFLRFPVKTACIESQSKTRSVAKPIQSEPFYHSYRIYSYNRRTQLSAAYEQNIK